MRIFRKNPNRVSRGLPGIFFIFQHFPCIFWQKFYCILHFLSNLFQLKSIPTGEISDQTSISIYNIDTDPSLIAILLQTDRGPMSRVKWSYWNEKVISSSSNNMVVEFKSGEDSGFMFAGFSATIHFTSIENKKCLSWMDMNNRMLLSPSYPNSYGNNIFCNCLITVHPDFHIKLDFLEFDVRGHTQTM